MAKMKIKEAKPGLVCTYGCNQTAAWEFVSGRVCCSKRPNSCKAVRLKNSKGCSQAYTDGRKDCSHFDGKRGWSKGLTKETSPSLKRAGDKITKHHREKADLTERSRYIAYKNRCGWDAAVIRENMPNIPGYRLLKELGMYHRDKNPGGVVRDHRFSIHDGYRLNVPESIMKHPANCRFMLQLDNARKSKQSELTYDQLQESIRLWRNW